MIKLKNIFTILFLFIVLTSANSTTDNNIESETNKLKPGDEVFINVGSATYKFIVPDNQDDILEILKFITNQYNKLNSYYNIQIKEYNKSIDKLKADLQKAREDLIEMNNTKPVLVEKNKFRFGVGLGYQMTTYNSSILNTINVDFNMLIVDKFAFRSGIGLTTAEHKGFSLSIGLVYFFN